MLHKQLAFKHVGENVNISVPVSFYRLIYVALISVVVEFGFINTQYTFTEDAGPQLLQITIQNAVTLDRDLWVIVNTNNLNAVGEYN